MSVFSTGIKTWGWGLAASLAWPGLALAAGEPGALEAPPPPEKVLDTGHTAWMLVSCALVLLMVPGLAMFYGGLTRTRNVLSTMMHSFVAMGIFGVQWVVIGFALAFGTQPLIPGFLGWSSDFLLLQGVTPATLWGESGVPTYLFAMFQGKFAIITPALIAGAFAERVRFKGYCLFILLWGFLVYDPLVYLVWNAEGMLFKDGAIDFAGGTVVHISAGVAGLVAVLFLGARRGYPHSTMKPNNLTMTLSRVSGHGRANTARGCSADAKLISRSCPKSAWKLPVTTNSKTKSSMRSSKMPAPRATPPVTARFLSFPSRNVSVSEPEKLVARPIVHDKNLSYPRKRVSILTSTVLIKR